MYSSVLALTAYITPIHCLSVYTTLSVLLYKGFNSLMPKILSYCLSRVPAYEFAIPQKVGRTVCIRHDVIIAS